MTGNHIQIALESGSQFGSIQIVDSVHIVASVNSSKEENRKNKGKNPVKPNPSGTHRNNAESKEWQWAVESYQNI